MKKVLEIAVGAAKKAAGTVLALVGKGAEKALKGLNI